MIVDSTCWQLQSTVQCKEMCKQRLNIYTISTRVAMHQLDSIKMTPINVVLIRKSPSCTAHECNQQKKPQWLETTEVAIKSLPFQNVLNRPLTSIVPVDFDR